MRWAFIACIAFFILVFSVAQLVFHINTRATASARLDPKESDSEPFNQVESLAFSTDGWLVAGCWDRKIRYWRSPLSQPKCSTMKHNAAILAVAFIPKTH